MKRLMYLLSRLEVLVLILLVFGVVLVILFYPAKKEYTEESIRLIILEDLASKYPESQYDSVDYEILQVDKIGDEWHLKAKVSLNKESPCPERIHLVYNYPSTKFVPEPPKYIVHNCKTCLGQVGCVILFEEQAIVASHTANNTEAVQEFIKTHPNAKPQVSKEGDYWIIIWRDLDDFIRVNISEDGIARVG